MSGKYFEYKEGKKPKIFIFPFAGGGASAFKDWQKEFKNIEIQPAHYPGKEERIKESPIDNIDILTREIFYAIQPHISNGQPSMIFLTYLKLTVFLQRNQKNINSKKL